MYCVQCRIKKVNRKALFNGCISHSVNLCGTHSFSVNASCVTFFGSMESLYTFFSGSTSRWERLKEYASVTVKRIVETRWSALFEAVKSVATSFDSYVDAINSLLDSNENQDTREAAGQNLNAILNYLFLCHLYTWCDIPAEVDIV